MKKLLNDLLKSPSGKYSRKSLIIMVTFLFVLLLGTFIVISDKVLDREINRYGVDIFDSLLVFLSVNLGLSVWDKKVSNKDRKQEEGGDI